MGIFLTILIVLLMLGSAFGGYRLALFVRKKKIRDEITFLQEENQRLREAVTYWNAQATGNRLPSNEEKLKIDG